MAQKSSALPSDATRTIGICAIIILLVPVLKLKNNQIKDQMEIRKLLVVLLIALLTFFTNYGQQNQDKMFQKDKPQFSIGIIADCQYCSIKGTGARKYSKSKEKLEHCTAHFNTLDLTYTIHLGDFVTTYYE
ncbi:hypothetical protein SAMN04487911_103148 [Arenibacter nanhaiticus]|uniref:Uncharacterized protein n=1 Tax=Arenibacter nanhaiticus TaxID=558155 RepID=A0A1M6CBG4_9FLAO|nr:hypothetical protein [Arenibacter nanhaiticus]SHI58352.1 hypothetical protein SAMN04487911_103148 [Arenibacter nanhaiticus]